MSKALVQQQFGAHAANYVTSVVHARGASLARLVELVQPQPGWTALDIATAAGHTAFAFAPHVARVTASDITPEMLSEAKKLAAERALTNVDFAPADAEALPWPDATFDLVTCRIAPHHFPDVAAFVAESFRVLKPGGTFALVDNVSPDQTTTPGFTEAELADAVRSYNKFEKRRDPSHGRALTVTEWQALVQQSGFTVRHSECLDKAMDFAAWVKTMAVPATVVPQLSAMLRGASPAFAAFIRPAETASAISFTLIALVLIATRPGPGASR